MLQRHISYIRKHPGCALKLFVFFTFINVKFQPNKTILFALNVVDEHMDENVINENIFWNIKNKHCEARA